MRGWRRARQRSSCRSPEVRFRFESDATLDDTLRSCYASNPRRTSHVKDTVKTAIGRFAQLRPKAVPGRECEFAAAPGSCPRGVQARPAKGGFQRQSGIHTLGQMRTRIAAADRLQSGRVFQFREMCEAAQRLLSNAFFAPRKRPSQFFRIPAKSVGRSWRAVTFREIYELVSPRHGGAPSAGVHPFRKE